MKPALILLAALAGTPAPAQEPPTWAEVGALLARRCTACHSGPDAPLGLHLDSLEGALRGSEDGPVLLPGDLGASELLRRVRGESEPRMPLVGDPLAPEEVALIEGWVAAGLPEGARGAPALAEGPAPPGPGEPVTFAHVEGIFLRRCALCHSDAREGGPPEGLRLDSYGAVLAGGERLVVLPGNPDASEVVRRVEGTARPRMPFDGPPWLSEAQLDLIRRWVADGARDAEGAPAPIPAGREVRFRGTATGADEIDGIAFDVTGGTRIDDAVREGMEAEVRGVVRPDGTIEATRLRAR